MNLLAKAAPPSEAAATSVGWHQLAFFESDASNPYLKCLLGCA